MNTETLSASRICVLSARLLISAVVAFWVWFLLADGGGHIMQGEQPLETLRWMITFGAPLIVIGITTWKWPRVGGALAVIGGAAAGFYFAHNAPRLLMALPLVLGGVTLLVASWLGKAHPPAAPTSA